MKIYSSATRAMRERFERIESIRWYTFISNWLVCCQFMFALLHYSDCQISQENRKSNWNFVCETNFSVSIDYNWHAHCTHPSIHPPTHTHTQRFSIKYRERGELNEEFVQQQQTVNNNNLPKWMNVVNKTISAFSFAFFLVSHSRQTAFCLSKAPGTRGRENWSLW